MSLCTGRRYSPFLTSSTCFQGSNQFLSMGGSLSNAPDRDRQEKGTSFSTLQNACAGRPSASNSTSSSSSEMQSSELCSQSLCSSICSDSYHLLSGFQGSSRPSSCSCTHSATSDEMSFTAGHCNDEACRAATYSNAASRCPGVNNVSNVPRCSGAATSRMYPAVKESFPTKTMNKRLDVFIITKSFRLKQFNFPDKLSFKHRPPFLSEKFRFNLSPLTRNFLVGLLPNVTARLLASFCSYIFSVPKISFP